MYSLTNGTRIYTFQRAEGGIQILFGAWMPTEAARDFYRGLLAQGYYRCDRPGRGGVRDRSPRAPRIGYRAI